MTVPIATTAVTVRRPAGAGDPYETPTVSTLATHVRAHISSPSGSETQTGGQSERVDAVLLCDVIAGLDHWCLVDDEETGETWSVVWARRRRGLGLDHMAAGLRATSGASSG